MSSATPTQPSDMKRIFERSHPEGGKEVATISIESDAVTVAIRDASSRSKGSPVRYPLKFCKGGSPELEGRAQALKLQTEGFTFVREEGASSNTDNQALLYVNIRKENIPDAVEYVPGFELPPGVDVSKLPMGGWKVSDTTNQDIVLVDGKATNSILLMNSPLVGVALLLFQEGLAVLAHETAPGPAGTKAVEAKALYGLAQTLDPELFGFLASKGIAPPGVVNTQGVARAVLL